MDHDLKDTIKKLEEAKTKQERIERIIIILSGLLIIVIFSVIGINIYSGKDETISEPEIDIVAEKTLNSIPKDELIPEEKPTLHKNISQLEKEKKTVEKKTENPATAKTENKTTETKKTTKNKPAKETKITKQEKSQEKKTVKKEKKTLPTVKTPEAGFYYIQLGAFSSRKKAEKFTKSLKSKNIYIINEKGLYKVLLGKFKSRKDAYKYMREKDIKGFVRKI
ncbi:SPOR domain-containing protein [Persephonella sp.]